MERCMMDLATVAEAVRGHVQGANVRFVRVTTDSRAVEPGDLFVALVGERHDGHAYVANAFGRGAVAALVAAGRGAFPGPVVAVDDPLVALGRQDLDPLSIEELKERIEILRAEIARVEAHMDAATRHRSAAEQLFKR